MTLKLLIASWAVVLALAACQREETAKASTPTPRLPYHGYNAFSERFRSPEALCGTNKDCLDSPLIAGTPEELAWLRAHGYPTLIQLRSLRALSTIVLEGEAHSDSTSAMIVLGARLVAENRKQEGVEYLTLAAQAKSIYAFYELSNAHGRGPALGDQLESAALLRVAEMLGDWKAAGVFNRRFPTIGRIERVIVEERAKFLLRNIVGDMRVDPRPKPRDS